MSEGTRGALAGAPRLKRRIGAGLLTVYGVGVMVGAGIYVLIGEVAAEAGYYAPLAFLLAGLAAAATGASFAELSARHPESAGEAAYAEAAFAQPALTLGVGLMVALVGLISAGAVLQGGVGYVAAIAPLPREAMIVGLALLLGAVAAIGVAESLWAAALFTLVELVGLAVVAAVAFSAEPSADAMAASAEMAAAFPGAAGLVGGVFLAFFAFIGFEDMVNMAEETKDPRRAMPRAILAAFLIVTAIYALVAFAALRVATPAALASSERPLALVYERASGGPAGFIALIAFAAALNGVLAQIIMASRVLFGLGRRAPALAWLHEAGRRFGTPLRATALATLLVLALSLSAPLGDLAGAATTLLLAIFIVMNAALIRLKRRGPPPPGAPDLGIWVPYAGLGLSAFMLAAGLTL